MGDVVVVMGMVGHTVETAQHGNGRTWQTKQVEQAHLL